MTTNNYLTAQAISDLVKAEPKLLGPTPERKRFVEEETPTFTEQWNKCNDEEKVAAFLYLINELHGINLITCLNQFFIPIVGEEKFDQLSKEVKFEFNIRFIHLPKKDDQD